MTQQQTLYTGVSRAAWGCFFLYFHINLGTINLLPAFVGYLLFLASIRLLEEERRDLALLRSLGILLTLWNVLDWAITLVGGTIEGRFVILELITQLAELYFHFQLLTDFAALAEKYQQAEDDIAQKIYKWRTTFTVLLTVSPLIWYMKDWIPDWWMHISAVFAFVLLVAGIRLMLLLFRLRKLFADDVQDATGRIE